MKTEIAANSKAKAFHFWWWKLGFGAQKLTEINRTASMEASSTEHYDSNVWSQRIICEYIYMYCKYRYAMEFGVQIKRFLERENQNAEERGRERESAFSGLLKKRGWRNRIHERAIRVVFLLQREYLN